MAVMPELHAMVTAHERVIQALLRELARTEPGVAGRLASRLGEVAREASADDGESMPYLVRLMEDYIILLRGPDLGPSP
jgi:hypothetical protein